MAGGGAPGNTEGWPGWAAELDELVRLNQGLLACLGVSHPRIEKVCETSWTAGGVHSKLTGAGGGGCVLTLLPPGSSPLPPCLPPACWTLSPPCSVTGTFHCLFPKQDSHVSYPELTTCPKLCHFQSDVYFHCVWTGWRAGYALQASLPLLCCAGIEGDKVKAIKELLEADGYDIFEAAVGCPGVAMRAGV